MIAPVQDNSAKVPLALPGPASVESPGGAQEVAAMIRQALNANLSAHAMAVDVSETVDVHRVVVPHTANAIAGPSTQDQIVFTQPGSQILTPQAQELADMIIDHTQFPDGVSPLTQIHRLQTPERLDTPLTTEELQRLMSSTSLDVSRPVTPANPTIEVIPQQHDGIDADSDVEMTIRDSGIAEDVFILGNGPVIGEDVGAPDVGAARQEEVQGELQEMQEDRAEEDEAQKTQEDGADEEQTMEEAGPEVDQGPMVQDHCAEDDEAQETAQDDSSAPPSSTTTLQAQPSTPRASRILRGRRPALRAVPEDSTDSDDSDSSGESEDSPPPNSGKRTVAAASRQQGDHQSGRDSTAHVGQDLDATETIVANAEGFKLSLEGTLRSVVRGPTTLLKQAAVPMADEAFTIKVFPLDPTADATDFEFRTHKNVVSNVYVLLDLA